MYAILFAGGVGQRLWPLSRKNSPKQFSPIMGDQSSFQLAVRRLEPLVSAENIYISTNRRYLEVLKSQASAIPPSNFILEPTRRDLAAAVALAFFTLYERGLRGSVMFQWADNYIQNGDELVRALKVANALIATQPEKVVFIGETPRFPNENLGWIGLGEEIGTIEGMPYYEYRSLTYRPPLDQCIEMYNSQGYVWNSGYFVSTIEFVVEEFRKRAPEITTIVEKIVAFQNTAKAEEVLEELYPTIPLLHFDTAFLERLDPSQAVLLRADLKWADPGSLYALKEALQSSQSANVTLGEVVEVDTYDSLIYNEETAKVVAVMGLEGVVVVNTADSLLVVSKQSVRYLGLLLDQLEKAGYGGLL